MQVDSTSQPLTIKALAIRLACLPTTILAVLIQVLPIPAQPIHLACLPTMILAVPIRLACLHTSLPPTIQAGADSSSTDSSGLSSRTDRGCFAKNYDYSLHCVGVSTADTQMAIQKLESVAVRV